MIFSTQNRTQISSFSQELTHSQTQDPPTVFLTTIYNVLPNPSHHRRNRQTRWCSYQSPPRLPYQSSLLNHCPNPQPLFPRSSKAHLQTQCLPPQRRLQRLYQHLFQDTIPPPRGLPRHIPCFRPRRQT